MSNLELNTKAKELKELKLMEEELKVQIAELEAAIKHHMDEAGVDTLITTDAKISWKAVTSTRLDSKALVELLGKEMVEPFMKTNTIRRFIIA